MSCRRCTAARRRVATGAKRVLPDRFVFTLQGDGDMVNEGLQEIIHCAARGERFTAVLLNNGVFGETGGHMTATSVLGQRTKTTHGDGPRAPSCTAGRSRSPT